MKRVGVNRNAGAAEPASKLPVSHSWLLWAGTLPAMALIGCVLVYTVNIPYQDDFDAFLHLLEVLPEATSPLQVISLLGATHNEHRIVFARAVACMSYFVLGKLDLRMLTYVGTSGLLVIWAVLSRGVKRTGMPPALLLPVPFLLFQPAYYEALTWAQVSLSNLWVYTFAILSFQLLSTSRRASNSILAFAAAAAATFTLGNGFLALLIGGAYLLVCRRIRGTLTWGVGTMFLLGLYFYQWHQPGGGNYATLFTDPLRVIGFYFAFVGSVLGPSRVPGAVLAMAFAVLVARRYHRQNAACFLSLLFLHASAGLSAVTRSHLPLEHAFVSRYRLVSTLFLTLTYLALAQNLRVGRRQRMTLPIQVSAIAFCVGSYLIYVPWLRHERTMKVLHMAAWVRTGHDTELLHPMPAAASVMLRIALDREIYQLPPNVLDAAQSGSERQ